MSSIVKKETGVIETAQSYVNQAIIYSAGVNLALRVADYALDRVIDSYRSHVLPYVNPITGAGGALLLSGAAYAVYTHTHRHRLRTSETALRSTLHPTIGKADQLYKKTKEPEPAKVVENEPPSKETDKPAPKSKKVQQVAKKTLRKVPTVPTRHSPRAKIRRD